MAKQAPSLGAGGAERRKPVRLWHGDVVSRMLRVDWKAKTEIPVKMVKEVATATAEDERNSKTEFALRKQRCFILAKDD